MEFVMILLIICAVVWAEGQFYRKNAFDKLEYRCFFSKDEAMEGDEIELVEEVSNGKFLPLPWLKAEISTSRWLDFAGSQSLVTEDSRFVPSFFMMKSRHRVVRRWKVKCLKRGKYHLDTVVLIATDLLGSVAPSISVEPHAKLTVLPRPVDMELGFQKVRSDSGPVTVRRHLLPDPFLIAGVREYDPRQSANRIHWMATARTGKLMVHRNEYSADQTLAVILNVQSREFEHTRPMHSERVEEAIRACAGFLDDTLASGIPSALMANASLTDGREPLATGFAWGREHVWELLHLLARLPLENTREFSEYLRSDCAKIHPSDLVLVTPYLCDGILEYALLRQAEGIRVKLVCTSPGLPENLPDSLEIFQFWRKEAGA